MPGAAACLARGAPHASQVLIAAFSTVRRGFISLWSPRSKSGNVEHSGAEKSLVRGVRGGLDPKAAIKISKHQGLD